MKGGGEHVLERYVTEHGPLVHDLFGLPEPTAFRSSVLQPQSTTFNGILAYTYTRARARARAAAAGATIYLGGSGGFGLVGGRS